MNSRCRLFFGLAAVVLSLAAMALAQDSPSLGELARQQREQKKQTKTSQSKDAKGSKVITNEEIPEHASSAPEQVAGDHTASTDANPDAAGQPVEDVKSQIEAQKGEIESLQKQIDQLNESIKFAPGNCMRGCEQWNERQKQKQQQVEQIQAQLEEEKKHLEEMQESARKQGLGSSVYEP